LAELLAAGPYPSRAIHENLADHAAQVAANKVGEELLLELVERVSKEVVLAYMGHIRDAAEAAMRKAIRKLPRGSHAFTDHLDDGSPLAVTLTAAGDDLSIDFTGTGGVIDGNLNANPSIVRAAVLYCFRCLIEEDIPLNDGVLAPLRIVLPEGLLNPPGHEDPQQCPAMVGGNVETSQRIVDAIFGALGCVAASQGTMNSFCFGNDTFGYVETVAGGAGAGPGFVGASAVHTHMTNTRLTDPEILEVRYPVRVRQFGIRRGSGGAGQFRGGDGVVREIVFLTDMQCSILSERRGPYRPYGLAGGEPGAAGKNTILRADGRQEDLGGKGRATLHPGDAVRIETPGGGGYGTPIPSPSGRWLG
jgi:5-oxoprolinase (ATP-hydrolysing)